MTELVKQEYVPATIIQTEALELAQTPERMRRAALARLTLGYQELSLAVGETRPKVSEEQVAEALGQAGVRVYDNQAVGAHKRKVALNHWNRGQWLSEPISEYSEPIPEFAIDTALKMKEVLPEATFYVEHYVVSRAYGDPFLSFRVPGVKRRFVIEVWDEPDFEAEKKP